MTDQPLIPQKDLCPGWATEKIEQLRQIEIFLGNIPKALAWQSDHVDDLLKRSFKKNEQVFDEEKAELVFQRLVRGLQQEGFSAAEVTAFINARIGYRGGPPYCSEAEVAAEYT